MSMSEYEYNHKTLIIYHMNSLVRSLNDEEAIACWLMNGVPDGVWTIDEIRETYDNDEFFEDDYEDMVEMFTKIISIESKNGSDPKGLFA